MSKGTKLLRKLLVTFLVVLMSINTFAAVVGDNDGAAFITKAEYDSLKNDFQEQIDSYNTSIDSKMDGKIASYLAGILLGVKPKLLLPTCRTSIGRNPYFMNSLTGTGSSSWTTALGVQKQKNYSTKYKIGNKLNTYHFWIQTYGCDVNLWGYNNATSTWATSTGNGGWNWHWGTSTDNNLLLRFDSYNTSFSIRAWKNSWDDNKKYTEQGTQLNHVGGLTYISNDATTAGMGGAAVSTSGGFLRLTCDRTTFVSAEIHTSGILSGTQTRPTTTYTVNNVPVSANASRNGSGACWQYRTTPWGTKILERYWTSWWPVQNLVLDYKTYLDFSGTIYDEGGVSHSDFRDSQSCSYTPYLTASYGIQTTGSKYSTYNTANLVGYCQQNITLNKTTTDTRLYEVAQWGTIPSSNIYCASAEPTLTKTTTNLSSYTNLASGYVDIAGTDHLVSGVTNNVYEITGTPESISLDTFEVSPYTSIAGETVYVGGGIPFAYTQTANSETTFKITFRTLNLSDAVSGSTPVKWMLSTKQFKDGDYANASDKLAEGTVTTNSSGTYTVTTTLDELPANQLIWLNAYSTTANRIVEVTDCSTSIK